MADDEIQIGNQLFSNFVRRHFQEQDLPVDPIIDDFRESPRYKNVCTSVGVEINDLAQKFGDSCEGKKISHLASQVDLSQITSEGFNALLRGVFMKGINVYNIIASFFYCSKILIRAVKSKFYEIGKNLFKWALQYIAEKVCTWIHDQGGWEKVFTIGCVTVAAGGVLGLLYLIFGM